MTGGSTNGEAASDDQGQAVGEGSAASAPTVGERTLSPPTEDRGRTAILWGLAGILSFGVVHQGYLLLGGQFLGIAPTVAVAVLVGVVVAGSAYSLSGRFAGANEQR